MTRSEILAYNAGVAAALALALKCAAALQPRLTEAPTRFNFAIGALEGVAAEGAALLLELPGHDNQGAIPIGPASSPETIGAVNGPRTLTIGKSDSDIHA